ncbi:hypothetical protein lacNasYZ03_11360 [Lactobacillus nasalidis]|uniref:Phage conserved hypothetical protein C-terminal domain-containing protein n=1 Tax=Lactobacillus nasalidis TaxID=2797258 RepID=A0ABQ3W8M6_9LACO|nr:conserved phage C-terminal domain-containing protein [Lactobacillus nasalidis]GHV97860.1 hypothetical protein lacNasYZ01_10420 [Lactobacillus nasalidis]GHW00090.1 hypothetical protein lacNasYZ02_15190 [Lactobacillus nasalidis]GHW01449.1 hypothetical protein lacNasYZ03_11360 [Lactobacillus nasalidis]
MSEFEGSKFFLMIPTKVSRDPELLKKPKAIILFGEIFTMLNATGKFYMSNGLLCERLDCKKTALKGYLNLLEDRGYIKRQVVYSDDKKQILGRYITLGPSLGRGSAQGLAEDTTGGRSQAQPRVGRNDDPKYINLRDQENISVEEDRVEQSSTTPAERIPYQQIIDYLNEKTGSRYKNVAGNQKMIKARWKEGNRLDDFKTVIDNKVADWADTVSKDGRNMNQYLRPSTLFGNKFDQYLNEKVEKDDTPPEYQDLFKDTWDPDKDDLPF